MERKYKLTFFYILYVVIDDVMEVRHIFYNRRDLQELLGD